MRHLVCRQVVNKLLILLFDDDALGRVGLVRACLALEEE